MHYPLSHLLENFKFCEVAVQFVKIPAAVFHPLQPASRCFHGSGGQLSEWC
jgi:hypothetical protein